jgi:S1-C subfamily serine protease
MTRSAENMKYSGKTALIILAMCLSLSPGTASAGVTDSVVPCVVFLTQENGPGHDVNFGTGFLLDSDNRPCLVTASHVAKDIGTDFKMVMPGSDGRGIVEKLEGVSWNISPSADCAYTVIAKGNREESRRLLLRSLPAGIMTARSLPPSRDIPLVAMGYPLGLGAKGRVSPLSFETKAASGFITLERFDNRKAATFILLQSPSISGLSGGPVFDVGRPLLEGGRLEARDGLSLVGLVSGVIWDKTGGKLAMIVPATEIARLFQRVSPRT